MSTTHPQLVREKKYVHTESKLWQNVNSRSILLLQYCSLHYRPILLYTVVYTTVATISWKFFPFF